MASRPPPRVVVLGSLSQDLHVAVDRHPRPGETVLGGAVAYRFGGKGANTAVAAARAGVPTRMVGRVGDDDAGRAYLERLRAYGVDADRVRVDPDAPTGLALVTTDRDGENAIVVAPGANLRVAPGDLDALADLGAGDVLAVSLEVDLGVVATAVRSAAGRGARVVLNLAPYATLPADVLDLADPVVVNQSEAELLAADGLQPPSLLTTRGPDGSTWGDLEVPAVRVRVVDTTGAGDAYCGTLAAALSRGEDRRTAMVAASAAAAECVGHDGAQPAG